MLVADAKLEGTAIYYTLSASTPSMIADGRLVNGLDADIPS